MNSGYEFDSLQFIVAGGLVSMGVAIILVLMSIATWYLIFVKTYQSLKLRWATRDYIARFWRASSVQSIISQKDETSPAATLVARAAGALEHHQRYAPQKQGALCSQEEFVARSMRKVLVQTSSQLEHGMTVLASVGSIAPFVGLFGTVWGIYHALASISMSGQATLDKVAGPVGEALIMTAMGLAVAIPAVLAYNAFVRSNRNLLATTDSFGQEVHVLLTTGAPLREATQQQGAAASEGKPVAAASLHGASA